MSLDNNSKFAKKSSLNLNRAKTAALGFLQIFIPHGFFILIWCMNFTAIPGIYLFWWLRKNQLFASFMKINITEISKQQWIMSLFFIFCYLVSSQINSETKTLSFSEDHFMPLVLFLPGLFAFALKLLAVFMLIISFMKQVKMNIRTLFPVP